MARKRIVCIKRSLKREDPYRLAGAAISKVLLEEVDGAPWSNHRQGGGEHQAQFLVGVAQRILDELGRVLAAEDET
jgi:hypothetical protein